MTKLLVLDLDGTLLHETKNQVLLRPGIEHFLQFCQDEKYAMAIWTAGRASPRLETIAAKLKEKDITITWEFVWEADQCTTHYQRATWFAEPELSVRKPLSKVWKSKQFQRRWTKQNTLIVDDTTSTYMHNYRNAIPIPTWKGDAQDKALYELCTMIKALATVQDVREHKKEGLAT